MTPKPKYFFLNRVYLALQGIFIATKRERHMKFHFIFSFLLLVPLLWIKLNPIHIWILIILIILLLITELINTAIEVTVDMISKKFSYRAKLAKDMASGSVLLMASLLLAFGIYVYTVPFLNFSKGSLIGN